MRSFYVMLVALVLLMGCIPATSAGYKKIGGPVQPRHRLLRSTDTSTTAETEERFSLTPQWLTRFRIWKLKRDASWDLNKTPKELAKEKLKADKLLEKEATQYTKWVKARFTPEYVYQKLGLLDLGENAIKSPNFRRYEAYKALWAEKANSMGAAGWIKTWWTRYQLNRLKSKAASEMKKAEDDLAKEVREYERWIKAKYTPGDVYDWLGLLALGNKATESKNFRHYDAYKRLWFERYPTST